MSYWNPGPRRARSHEHFLNGLRNYARVSPLGAVAEIIVEIMVTLLPTLSLLTGQIRQNRLTKFSLAHTSVDPTRRSERILGENGDKVDTQTRRPKGLTLDEARRT